MRDKISIGKNVIVIAISSSAAFVACSKTAEEASKADRTPVGSSEGVGQVAPALAAEPVSWVSETVEEIVDPSLPAGRCPGRRVGGICRVPTSDDEDADGYLKQTDCIDQDPFAHPGAREVRCNFVDEDCDGKDFCPTDADGDGFAIGADCDDHNRQRNPRAVEVPCNGVDDDCNGYDDCDRDGDGRPSVQDCDDRNPAAYSGALERVCDGIDQDCDGSDCCENDGDRDGFPCRSDCNDREPKVHPGAAIPSGCHNVDFNCDGKLDAFCR